jgi:S-DNA-T family DNA segregation ATPase FtsK/SpoIIIE
VRLVKDALPSLVDEAAEDGGLVVDGPATGLAPAAGRVAGAVLPAWARDRSAVAALAKSHAGYYGRTAAFHSVRAPLYWARLAGTSPRGGWRLVAGLVRWVSDPGGRAALSGLSVASAGDAATLLRLREHHRTAVRTRLAGVAGGTLAAGIALGVLSVRAPLLGLLAGLVLLAVLGLAGRGNDASITSRPVRGHEAPKLTSDLILAALAALGIGELNKAMKLAADAVRFTAPITRDGPGWRADIDLPPGVTAGDVIERRDRLASGLRRPVSCVWPEPDPDSHAGRLVLWVADRPLSAAKPVPWLLTVKGKANVFDPVPVGVDPRGRPVTIGLMYAAGIIGAIPRMGKTFLLRLLLLAAALDVRAELHVYNLKGGADLDALALVAHRYRTGDDDEDVEYLLRDLHELVSEMRRRYKLVRDLPKTRCPESKVTDELASDETLGLHPILLALDECGVAFEHPVHGKEIEEHTTALVKRGPAVAIMVWDATQRPDAKSLPTGISSSAALRICLKVMGHTENDMVLGSGAYKAGVRATMFSRKDLGVAYLAGEGDDLVIVRTAYIDNPAAEKIATRARTARLAAGRLTGHAAGIDPEPEKDTDSILDHLVTVWPAEQPKVWSDELAALLAGTFPGQYDGWSGEQIAPAVAPHRIRPVQIKRVIDGRAVNRRGLTRHDVHAAIAARDHPTEPRSGS